MLEFCNRYLPPCIHPLGSSFLFIRCEKKCEVRQACSGRYSSSFMCIRVDWKSLELVDVVFHALVWFYRIAFNWCAR